MARRFSYARLARPFAAPITKFRVWVMPEAGTPYSTSFLEVAGDQSSVTVPSLLPGKFHQFRVQAYNGEVVHNGDACAAPTGDGFSLDSPASVQLFTLTTPPDTPAAVALVEV